MAEIVRTEMELVIGKAKITPGTEVLAANDNTFLYPLIAIIGDIEVPFVVEDTIKEDIIAMATDFMTAEPPDETHSRIRNLMKGSETKNGETRITISHTEIRLNAILWFVESDGANGKPENEIRIWVGSQCTSIFVDDKTMSGMKEATIRLLEKN